MNLTVENFKEADDLHMKLINGRISHTDIEENVSLVPLDKREEFYSHLNSLLLNAMINGPAIYGYIQEMVDLAQKCRAAVYVLIMEMRDPEYMQIKREKKLNKIIYENS